MTIVIQVDSNEGEESTWLSEITYEEYTVLSPILDMIKSTNGYIPVLQEENLGLRTLKSCLPTPPHGFNKICRIDIFCEDPITYFL